MYEQIQRKVITNCTHAYARNLCVDFIASNNIATDLFYAIWKHSHSKQRLINFSSNFNVNFALRKTTREYCVYFFSSFFALDTICVCLLCKFAYFLCLSVTILLRIPLIKWFKSNAIVALAFVFLAFGLFGCTHTMEEMKNDFYSFFFEIFFSCIQSLFSEGKNKKFRPFFRSESMWIARCLFCVARATATTI